MTEDVGSYSFATVEAGTYTLRVSKEGFSTTSESDVTVTTNHGDITLQPLTVATVEKGKFRAVKVLGMK